MTSVMRPVKRGMYLENFPPHSHRDRPEIWPTLEFASWGFCTIIRLPVWGPPHCSEWGWETPDGSVWVCTGVHLSLYKVCVESVSRSVVSDSATPWTVAHQTPLFKGFSRQGYWSGLPFPSPQYLPDAGIEPESHALQADSLPLSH